MLLRSRGYSNTCRGVDWNIERKQGRGDQVHQDQQPAAEEQHSRHGGSPMPEQLHFASECESIVVYKQC